MCNSQAREIFEGVLGTQQCEALDLLSWWAHSIGSILFCSARVFRELECSTIHGEEHVQTTPTQTVIKSHQMGLGRLCCLQAFILFPGGHMTFPEGNNTIHPFSNLVRLASPNGWVKDQDHILFHTSDSQCMTWFWERRIYIDIIMLMKFYKQPTNSSSKSCLQCHSCVLLTHTYFIYEG